MRDLGFVHRWVPGSLPTTLVLLHGTGGDENSLLDFGGSLLPGASLLSPRGKVLEGGAPRFFRRFAEGVFDYEDVEARTQELADFLRAASTEFGFDLSRTVAVGYSNGANVAATLLLRRPEVLGGAVLLRAMTVLEDAPPSDLTGKNVLLLSGRDDPIVPLESATRLADDLLVRGASVDRVVLETGHGLTREDFDIAARRLRESP
ncbi:MAG: alpha/beta hydrolase [Fimbriimonadaceae bacterium]|nr:alpha/beta hydrolase [Fimbriimonadaceae bacterium]